MAADNRRAEGSHYEDLAAHYLMDRGHRILEKNFRCRMGEIDLISLDRSQESDIQPATLVFTEVKFRSSLVCGEAVRAVDQRKQKTIYRVAQFYMVSHQLPEDTLCRFDVIAFDGDRVHHYPNAFGGM